MRPIDTLYRKIILSDALDNPYMHRFFTEWANRDPATRYAMPSKKVRGRIVPYTGQEIAEQMQTGLRMTENFFVGKDVTEVLREIAKVMPPEVLHKEDLPATHGFVVFEEPFMLTDVNVKVLPVRALMWFTEIVGKAHTEQQQGLVIWALIDFDDRVIDNFYKYSDQDKLVRDMVSQGIQFTPATVFSVGFENYSFELADATGSIVGSDEKMVLVDNHDGTWTVTTTDASWDPIKDQRLPAFSKRVIPEPLVTFLQALWRFQKQELTSREEMWTPKTTSKQLLRRQLQVNPVSIVHLRRRAPGPEGNKEWQLSHRFIVRGHWRRQWYPSEKRHMSIWIRAHSKGPENAPWLIRDVVTAIVR